MQRTERMIFLRTTIAGTVILGGLALYLFARPFYNAGVLFASPKWMALSGLAGLLVVASLGLLVLSWTSLWGKAIQGFEAGLRLFQRLGIFNFVLFGLGIALFSYLTLGRYGHHLLNLPLRFLLFWLLVLAGSVCLRAGGLQRSWGELFAAALLFAALGYRIAAYMPDITSYPFSLGWSEASRYYYASLYFSTHIYGMSVPPTVLHPSRYLMQSLAFIIPNSPLWFHRFWQVCLWISVTAIGAFALARRLVIEDRLRWWMMFAWAFLFLLLGPVYYHLLVPVIIVLLCFDRRRFWKSLGIILLASTWAGISRINWFPVPGMLAAVLYFLEVNTGGRPFWRYLVAPLVWALSGTAVAFAAQALYAVWSGNPAEQFASSFTSDLLWYRLLPNPTYPLGILPAAVLVSLPLFLIISIWLAGRWTAYHPIRLLGLAAILLVLFTGGLVVSTKIGGGSNLHNLDAYLTMLAVITAHLLFNRFIPEQPEQSPPAQTDRQSRQSAFRFSLAFTVLLPVYLTVEFGAPLLLPSRQGAQNDFEALEKFVSQAVAQGGEVLFISEREMLTFEQIEGVPLVPEYEQVFLMEMAMAGNQVYLENFYQDLQNQRFALIVTDPLFIQYKGRTQRFGEENDAWVSRVSKPILCYYESQKLLRNVRVQVLVPRAEIKDCP